MLPRELDKHARLAIACCFELGMIRVPLWTGYLPIIPIYFKISRRIAFACHGLPFLVLAGRTYQINLLDVLALYQHAGTHITCVD